MATNFNAINRAASFNPTGPFPLDKRAYFESLSDANKAATSAVEATTTSKQSAYYIGQTVVVVNGGKSTEYIITPNKTLERVGPYYGTSNNITIDASGCISASGKFEGASTQVFTGSKTDDKDFYVTFVDSDNTTATGESVYTTSKLKVNPSTGKLSINGCTLNYDSTNKKLVINGALDISTSTSTDTSNNEYQNQLISTDHGLMIAAGEEARSLIASETTEGSLFKNDWLTLSADQKVIVRTNCQSANDTKTYEFYEGNVTIPGTVNGATINSTSFNGATINSTSFNEATITAEKFNGATIKDGEITLDAGKWITLGDDEVKCGSFNNDYGMFNLSAIKAHDKKCTGIGFFYPAASDNGYIKCTFKETSTKGVYESDYFLVSRKIHAPSFNANSDARLKENFTPLTAKKSILDLPTYKFDFIDGAKNQVGCKAQDLQEICPEIVDEDSDGYLSIQESKIVYLLLEEVKELKARIEYLEKGDI